MRFAAPSPTLKAARAPAPAARPPAGRAPIAAVRGNQAALRRLQPKLKVGAANDPLEHEADAVADRVMRMPDPGPLSRASPLRVSRKCAACEAEDEKKLHMKRADPGAAIDEAPPLVDEALRSPGQPLDANARRFFEPRFGYDFSGVRVHSDARSASAARAIRARAYTVGNDIGFGAGEYAPGSSGGRALLAHELAHVVQQGGAAPAGRGAGGSAPTGARRLQRAPDDAADPGSAGAAGGPASGGADPGGAQPTGGDMDLTCHYRLGCPISVPCEGKRVCGIANCGTGSCNSPLCPPGLKNLVFKAWCQYDCLPSGAAFLLITAFGGYTMGPYCLDGPSSAPKAGAMPGSDGALAGSDAPPAAGAPAGADAGAQ